MLFVAERGSLRSAWIVRVGFTPGRSYKDAAIDDEQVLYIMAAAPVVHDRPCRVSAHPRGAHQMPTAFRDGRFVPKIVWPRGAEELAAALDAWSSMRRLFSLTR
jgi:hypothetical protein